MKLRNSIIASAWLGLLCAILTKAGPLKGSEIDAKGLTNDISHVTESPRMNPDEIGGDKPANGIPKMKQGPGDGGVALNSRTESKSHGQVEKSNTMNKNVDAKKSSDLTNQDDSIFARFRKKIDELINTLISQWPKKNLEETKAVVQPEVKSVVGQKSASTTSSKNAGLLKTWYLFSKSPLARLFRLIRRYFTLNKAKPVKPPEKVAETAEKAAEGKPPVKAQEVKEGFVAGRTAEGKVKFNLPEKDLVIKSKTQVLPVGPETLSQAIESIPQTRVHQPEKEDVLTTPSSFNPQTVKAR